MLVPLVVLESPQLIGNRLSGARQGCLETVQDWRILRSVLAVVGAS